MVYPLAGFLVLAWVYVFFLALVSRGVLSLLGSAWTLSTLVIILLLTQPTLGTLSVYFMLLVCAWTTHNLESRTGQQFRTKNPLSVLLLLPMILLPLIFGVTRGVIGNWQTWDALWVLLLGLFAGITVYFFFKQIGSTRSSFEHLN